LRRAARELSMIEASPTTCTVSTSVSICSEVDRLLLAEGDGDVRLLFFLEAAHGYGDAMRPHPDVQNVEPPFAVGHGLMVRPRQV
jgi:hypothetical protein